jgi:hypothetical protein
MTDGSKFVPWHHRPKTLVIDLKPYFLFTTVIETFQNNFNVHQSIVYAEYLLVVLVLVEGSPSRNLGECCETLLMDEDSLVLA